MQSTHTKASSSPSPVTSIDSVLMTSTPALIGLQSRSSITLGQSTSSRPLVDGVEIGAEAGVDVGVEDGGGNFDGEVPTTVVAGVRVVVDAVKIALEVEPFS